MVTVLVPGVEKTMLFHKVSVVVLAVGMKIVSKITDFSGPTISNVNESIYSGRKLAIPISIVLPVESEMKVVPFVPSDPKRIMDIFALDGSWGSSGSAQ